MAVQNIECQIAQAQLGPYLAGEALGAEAIRQLEAHFANCTECKETLSERKRALIDQIETTPATKRTPPASGLGKAVVSRVAVAEVDSPQVAASAPAAKSTPKWKPLALSGGLAVVLLAMSYFGKNGFELLGPKAAVNLPASVPQSSPSPTVVEPVVSAPPAAIPAPEPPIAANELIAIAMSLASTPSLGEPAPELDSAPQAPIARKPAKRVVRRSGHSRPVRAPRSSVRVYDASGNPIQS